LRRRGQATLENLSIAKLKYRTAIAVLRTTRDTLKSDCTSLNRGRRESLVPDGKTEDLCHAPESKHRGDKDGSLERRRPVHRAVVRVVLARIGCIWRSLRRSAKCRARNRAPKVTAIVMTISGSIDGIRGRMASQFQLSRPI
jgi:hypothetical protein